MKLTIRADLASVTGRGPCQLELQNAPDSVISLGRKRSQMILVMIYLSSLYTLCYVPSTTCFMIRSRVIVLDQLESAINPDLAVFGLALPLLRLTNLG